MNSIKNSDDQSFATVQDNAAEEQSHAHYHEKAVEHHQHAATQHAQAAECYCAGDDAKGAYHAHLANGYGLLAKLHANEANMHFSKIPLVPRY